MSTPENCPWMHTSPRKVIYEDLESWRSHQGERLRFPLNSVTIHVSLGYGEMFCYVNILYYEWILFLNREYIPFLPTSESEPQGPVDPPLLQAASPDGRWAERANELFHAAACITNILEDLEELDRPLATPFAGFCAFSIATMNIYVAAFPRMNMGRSPNADISAELHLIYIDKFRHVWKIGNGLVNWHMRGLLRNDGSKADIRQALELSLAAVKLSGVNLLGGVPEIAEVLVERLF
ncbi:hypothetical protein BP5796_12746 [Coleophoma crateriformis]|uniref:Transcription factor domain-containing protein n=1 Tax=Coleophoma crateriformis TaxID=565419 RepID=A0A3D8Q649_9HELO|nr:hypothetical protein BP5796_12746 [Coleophoma crateriformis]